MNCDPIARWYAGLEYLTLGRALERCRFQFLPLTRPVRRALLFGDGDGRFAARLVELHPEAEIWSVELSGEMVAVARERVRRAGAVVDDGRCGPSGPQDGVENDVDGDRPRRQCHGGAASGDCQAEVVALGHRPQARYAAAGEGQTRAEDEQAGRRSRVQFVHGDALTVPLPDGEFDLVVTMFFLDCFEGEALRRVVRRAAAAATADATWLYSDFHVPPTGWRRWRAWAWVRGLYLAFRLLTGLRVRQLEDVSGLLEAEGFARTDRVTSSAELLVAERWVRADERRRCAGDALASFPGPPEESVHTD